MSLVVDPEFRLRLVRDLLSSGLTLDDVYVEDIFALFESNDTATDPPAEG